jgi:SAM-dependent methyltransferase
MKIYNIMCMVSQSDVIKTVSYDQEEIIKNIIKLYCPDGTIEVDPTFSKGNFYKNIPKPKYIYDLNPQTEDTQQADCRKLPHEDNSINSIMFDPPFLAGIPTKHTDGSNIILERFGVLRNIQNELWGMYHAALKEFHRILKPNGILIFKCQDTINTSKQFLSHVEIINYAVSLGFYPKDLFVLIAKNRVISSKHAKQQHARKYHSYFIVFIKQESPVKYFKINNSGEQQN